MDGTASSLDESDATAAYGCRIVTAINVHAINGLGALFQ